MKTEYRKALLAAYGMRELLASIALVIGLFNACEAFASDVPNLPITMALSTLAIVFALLANAARRPR